MARRAQQYIAKRRPRFEPSRRRQEQLTNQFMHACIDGDMNGLLNLLTDDITLWSDGGGKVPAALNAIYGAEKVIRLIVGVMQRTPKDLALKFAWVNGQPGFIAYAGSEPLNVATLDIADDQIQALRIVQNPDKLQTIPKRTIVMESARP